MSTKNRNGKPTYFQLNALKQLNFKGKVTTYRDAENALKRLRRATATKKGSTPKARSAAKPKTAPKKPSASAKKQNPTPCALAKVAKQPLCKTSPFADKNKLRGHGTVRVILPDSAQGKALKALMIQHAARMERVFNDLNHIFRLFF